MLTPTVEFVDKQDIVLPPPVKKLIWNGTEFVPFLLYRRKGTFSPQQQEWLWNTYGKPGAYKYVCHWDYLKSGDVTYMDDKVYMFYTMKWGAK